MARKPDVKRLLSKGLSGKEAGRLVVQDLHEADRGKGGFLSRKDIEDLKAGLKTHEDITDYNRLVDLYKAVYMTMEEAEIASLQVEKHLRSLESRLEGYVVSAGVRHIYRLLPIIVTEKDYRALKARQKRRLKKRLYCLGEVLEKRTEELLGGWQKAEEATDETWDKAWKAADQEVQKLIDDGKLKPLRLGHRADLIAYAEAKKALEDPLELEDLTDDGEPAEKTTDHHAAYLARLEESVAQGDLSEGHDVSRWSADLDPEDDEDRLLYHYVSGDQLYKAGLPEWKLWIDEFKPYEEDKDHEGGIAVIREEGGPGSDVDAKGHYRNTWLDRLRDFMQVQRIEEEYRATRGLSAEEVFRTILKTVRVQAQILQAYLRVLQEAGAACGIDFALEEVLTISDVRTAAEDYSRMAKTVSGWRGEIRGPRLPAFDLDQVKPDKAVVDTLRERIALGIYGEGLGDGWWKEVSDG